MSAEFHTPKPEMFWRSDPLVEAARKLPEWVEFHRICGRHSLCFDHIERENRRGYKADAMRMLNRGGGWYFQLLGTGRGAGVLDALREAYEAAGVDVPGAREMLARGLAGRPRDEVGAPTATAADPAPTVISEDPFEELFA